MSSASVQDIRDNVSKHISHLDSTVRSTLTDLKQNGDSAISDLRKKGDARVADIKSRSSSQVSALLSKANYAARTFWERYLDFARDSPAVCAFLSIQLFFAAIPLLVFSGFIFFTTLTVAFFASCIVATIAFFAGLVLVSVLAITSIIGVSVFTFTASAYLAIQWAATVRQYGVQQGTRKFLFGVEKKAKNEAQHAKVFALRAEDKVSEHTGQSKLEDFVPGANKAA